MAEIAAILARVGGGVDPEQLCLAAVDIEQRRRDVLRLRRSYATLRGEFPSWAAFLADAIKVGEWDKTWGDPGETG